MSPAKTHRFKLPDAFVQSYAELQPEWGPLGWVTYKRTYARWADRAQTRREEWYETVRRVVEGNINLDPRERTPAVVKELAAEAKEMFDTIFHLAWTPPGRGLWISGTPYSFKNGDAMVNCWNIDVRPGCYEGEDRPKPSFPFVMAMDLLAKGGGVGANVTRENVLQFPLVQNPLTVHFVCDPHHANIHEVEAGPIPQVTHTMIRVEDSREGWYNALRVVIDAHFKKSRERHVVFDVSDIRPFGTPIHGFGGTAAGPGPLVKMLRDINNLLNDLVGTQLSTVEAVDMMNMIGRCIVAGNVRRSAELMLGSGDDLAFIAMKQNQEKLLSHRWASNNSIAIDSSFTDFERIAQGIIMNGEPGIVNLELARTRLRLGDDAVDERNLSVTGTNPCVTGDTWVFTDEGPRQVIELLGRPHGSIVNGHVHATSEHGFWSTGVKDVLKVETQEGYSLRLTPNHRVLRVDQLTRKKEYLSWAEASELKPGDQIKLHDHRSLESWSGPGSFKEGWLIGELIGDGTFDEGAAYLDFWGDEAEDMAAVAVEAVHSTVGGRSDLTGHEISFDRWRVGSSRLRSLAEGYGCVRHSKEVTPAMQRTSSEFQRGLLRGLFDADGSVVGNQKKGLSVRLSQSNPNTLEQVQMMLLRLGIASVIYRERRPEGLRSLPNGKGGYADYHCQANHELVISNDNIFRFSTLIGFTETAKSTKLANALAAYVREPNRERFIATVSTVVADGVEEVFDCTVPAVGCFDANGLVAHNCGEIVLGNGESCNLAEIYPAVVERKGFDMESILRMALRYTKRVTCASYSWPTSKEIVGQNRRVGVSLSGIRDWMLAQGVRDLDDQAETLDGWYKIVRDEDVAFSAKLGVPTSVAVTTVKPSGTVSLLNGSSPGLHAPWSPYMIRRVRFQSSDPLVDLLKECGFLVEPDAYSPNTVVAEFPVAAPNADKADFVSAGDLSLEEQFATQAALQRWWSDNSVSATLTFKKDERKKIASLLREYRDQIKSTSLLPYQDPTEDSSYVQSPYEAITRERYEEIVAGIKCWPHEMATRLHEEKKHEYELLSQEDCAGGACPIK